MADGPYLFGFTSELVSIRFPHTGPTGPTPPPVPIQFFTGYYCIPPAIFDIQTWGWNFQTGTRVMFSQHDVFGPSLPLPASPPYPGPYTLPVATEAALLWNSFMNAFNAAVINGGSFPRSVFSCPPSPPPVHTGIGNMSIDSPTGGSFSGIEGTTQSTVVVASAKCIVAPYGGPIFIG